MYIVLSLLICIVGAIIVLITFPGPNRWAEIGRAMLWMGLIAFLLLYHGQPFTVVK